MLRIRLKRLGRKHSPFYRIVVTDIRNRRDGAPLLELGYYNPMSKQLKLDKLAALEWISKGAQPSETALRLINRADDSNQVMVLEPQKKEKLSRKALEKLKAEKAAEEAAKAAAAEAEKKAAEEAAAAKAAAKAAEAEAAAKAKEEAAAAAEAPAAEAVAEEAPAAEAETPAEEA